MFSAFNWQQMTSAFIVLFAVIDIIGSIPIIINLKEKGKELLFKMKKKEQSYTSHKRDIEKRKRLEN